MFALLVLLVVIGVSSTDVKFTPGPGLKQNADGSYSRVLDKEYLEAVGAGGSEPDPSSSSTLANICISLLLFGAAALYINREAVAAFAMSSSNGISVQNHQKKDGRPKKPMTESELAQARAARLARFTGDGPKKAQEAFQEALEHNELHTSKKVGGGLSATGGGGIATLGSLASVKKNEDKPEEYFGGDSTNTQY
mmetsp:Transcript_9899/g.13723  ORF Transcript_9899/g.13723 Transcript_9899/m.13723 type:complete len:195 (-) Transcript_9899:1545-2129(-)